MPRPIHPALVAACLGMLAVVAAPAGAAVRPCDATAQAGPTPCEQPAEPPCVAAPCR